MKWWNASGLVLTSLFFLGRCLHTVSWQFDGEPKGESGGTSSFPSQTLPCLVEKETPADTRDAQQSWCNANVSLPAGERAADVAAGHVQSEQRDAQRPGSGLTGSLQTHGAHRRPRHGFPDAAADTGRREVAVEGRPQPALEHQGSRHKWLHDSLCLHWTQFIVFW